MGSKSIIPNIRPRTPKRPYRLARRFNFLMSAGSDFHGVTKPTVHLGQIYQGRAGDDALLART